MRREKLFKLLYEQLENYSPVLISKRDYKDVKTVESSEKLDKNEIIVVDGVEHEKDLEELWGKTSKYLMILKPARKWIEATEGFINYISDQEMNNSIEAPLSERDREEKLISDENLSLLDKYVLLDSEIKREISEPYLLRIIYEGEPPENLDLAEFLSATRLMNAVLRRRLAEKERKTDLQKKTIRSLEEHRDSLLEDIESIKSEKEKELEALREERVREVEELKEERVREVEELERELEEEREKVEEEQERRDREVAELERELEEERERVEEEQERRDREVAELERELDEIKQSISFRLGSAVGDTVIGRILKDERQ